MRLPPSPCGHLSVTAVTVHGTVFCDSHARSCERAFSVSEIPSSRRAAQAKLVLGAICQMDKCFVHTLRTSALGTHHRHKGLRTGPSLAASPRAGTTYRKMTPRGGEGAGFPPCLLGSHETGCHPVWMLFIRPITLLLNKAQVQRRTHQWVACQVLMEHGIWGGGCSSRWGLVVRLPESHGKAGAPV